MRTLKLLSLGFVAAMLWNCEQTTQTQDRAQLEKQITPGINALTKAAALNAGLQMSREIVPPTNADPFSADALKAMKDAGLCSDFIALLDELVKSEGDSTATYPRLTAVFECVERNAQGFSAATTADQILSVVDKCFCNGSGSLFAGIDAFNLNRYSAPTVPGGRGYAPPTLGSTYSAPTFTGYSAPSIPGYSAPSL